MIKREKIQDWRGKIIGFVDEDSATGNKVARDFYGRIVGRYNKRLDITQDFYGRQVARGDKLLMTLQNK